MATCRLYTCIVPTYGSEGNKVIEYGSAEWYGDFNSIFAARTIIVVVSDRSRNLLQYNYL